MTTRDEYVGPSSEDLWATLPNSAFKERIIQICIQQDDGMYGLSNYGNLYFLRFGKWEKTKAELPE
jgi:hypothetical protein